LNPKIKSEIGGVVIAMILVVGVLTFSLSSQLQSADAKKDKDKYDKLRESLRKKAEATARISDRGDVDIFRSNTNTSSAIGIDGADGVNGTDGADGISGMSADGINGIAGADNTSNAGAKEGAGGAKVTAAG
jgi:hypothetical protein